MFNNIQDYLCGEIDLKNLIDNIEVTEEYIKADKETKKKIDSFFEELKNESNEINIIEKLSDIDYFINMGIEIDAISLLDLATRTNGGPVPYLDPGELLAFIDTCIEKKDDERVMRLAYNYDAMIYDKSKIEDYYIESKNAFYLNELAFNNLQGIHYDKIEKALEEIGNKEEIEYFKNNKELVSNN